MKSAFTPLSQIAVATAPGATHYRVYRAGSEDQLAGRRPLALFDETDSSPFVLEDVAVTTSLYYRVIAMNDTRIGFGGPVAVSPTPSLRCSSSKVKRQPCSSHPMGAI